MNWRYAIGEVALIVVGVLIALGATSWYEDIQLRKSERNTLSQIRQALESDLEDLQRAFELQLEIRSSVRKLVAAVDEDRGYSEEMSPLFGYITRWRSIESNSAPYQALKSRGFELISDGSIRIKLVEYYEDRWPPLLNTYLNDKEFVRRNVVPYFLRNFRQEDGRRISERWHGQYAPIDFEALKDDPEFRNLCMTKINRIEGFTIPSYESSIKLIRELIAMISEEDQ